MPTRLFGRSVLSVLLLVMFVLLLVSGLLRCLHISDALKHRGRGSDVIRTFDDGLARFSLALGWVDFGFRHLAVLTRYIEVDQFVMVSRHQPVTGGEEHVRAFLFPLTSHCKEVRIDS